MPNWCSNVVTISFDDYNEKQLRDALHEEKELFMQFVPRPKEYDEGDAWYMWNVDNWGTKWDAKPYNIEWGEGSVKFSIETAWGPCNKFWEALEGMGYSVTSYYLEEGMAFCGCYEDYFDDYYDYGNMSVYDLPGWAEDIFGIVSRYEEERELEEEEDFDEEDEDEDDDEESGPFKDGYQYETTEWYDKEIKPVRVGTYQVMTESWPFPQKCYWNGSKWQHVGGAKITQWRGITEWQHNMIAEMEKLKEEFDRLMTEDGEKSD